jgi:hypothetical protein
MVSEVPVKIVSSSCYGAFGSRIGNVLLGIRTTVIEATRAVSKAVASGFSRTSGPPKGGHHVGFETA